VTIDEERVLRLNKVEQKSSRGDTSIEVGGL